MEAPGAADVTPLPSPAACLVRGHAPGDTEVIQAEETAQSAPLTLAVDQAGGQQEGTAGRALGMCRRGVSLPVTVSTPLSSLPGLSHLAFTPRPPRNHLGFLFHPVQVISLFYEKTPTSWL